ncbi:hypothetical protein K7432_018026 [Basidiobolus ranarum]|uniref:Uncharacterized protein n=1 Tax=Basidiobolus ranarum TaxID=34480 RepID=A0ABR2VKN9_9FUNG
MGLPQLYDQNDVDQNATFVKPISPDNFEDLLLDVDLGYSSTDGSISEVEEEDKDFVTDSLLLANISPLMFQQWLVGMTDGDGSFSILRQNDK